MNLRRRISKLRESGKNVELHNYSIFSFESGYYVDKAIAVFWVWAFAFLAAAFILFWWGTNIYKDRVLQSNPQAASIEAQREKENHEYDLKKRQDDHQRHLEKKNQYIDGCKAAGKSPADMGDDTSMWECK